ncbi:MAG: hypothetical protein ABI040_03940, partial [Rhodoferax sp.]
ILANINIFVYNRAMDVNGAPIRVQQMRSYIAGPYECKDTRSGQAMTYPANIGLTKEFEMENVATWAMDVARLTCWTHENFRIQALPCLEGGPIR